MNAAATSGGTVLTFNTTGLSTNGQGKSVFSSLSQLLSSLVGYGGSSAVPSSVEALPEVQSLISEVNTNFIAQQTQYGLFSTFGLQVTNSTQQSLPTVAALTSFASGFVDQGVNKTPYLNYMASYVSAPFTISRIQNGTFPLVGLYIPRSSIPYLVSGVYNNHIFTSSLSLLLDSITTSDGRRLGPSPTVVSSWYSDISINTCLYHLSLDLASLMTHYAVHNYTFTYFVILFTPVLFNDINHNSFPSFDLNAMGYQGISIPFPPDAYDGLGSLNYLRGDVYLP